MKNVAVFLSFALLPAAFAETPKPKPVDEQTLVSPFPSTVKELGIPNSHEVSRSGKGFVIRGMRPRTVKDIEQLKKLGVTDVLIFRDSPGGKDIVTPERKLLKEGGMGDAKVSAIPFKWKEFKNFEEPCRQTVQALKLLHEAETAGRGMFFHCTVGEDRTGYLAALYRVIYQGADPRDTFEKEMCANGYADGNPQKPGHVADAVHAGVTPLFQKMIYKIQKGYFKAASLSEKECAIDPEEMRAFKPEYAFGKCNPSPNYNASIK
jgi:hypothetical protein